MFMQNEWSDDDLEDGLDEVVVPMSMVPKPQVLSGGQNLGASSGTFGSENRASAYNERMERARNAVQNQRKSSASGMMMANADRPSSARNTGRQKMNIDILAQEVDEMALEEEKLEERAQQLHKETAQESRGGRGARAGATTAAATRATSAAAEEAPRRTTTTAARSTLGRRRLRSTRGAARVAAGSAADGAAAPEPPADEQTRR